MVTGISRNITFQNYSSTKSLRTAHQNTNKLSYSQPVSFKGTGGLFFREAQSILSSLTPEAIEKLGTTFTSEGYKSQRKILGRILAILDKHIFSSVKKQADNPYHSELLLNGSYQDRAKDHARKLLENNIIPYRYTTKKNGIVLDFRDDIQMFAHGQNISDLEDEACINEVSKSIEASKSLSFQLPTKDREELIGAIESATSLKDLMKKIDLLKGAE